MTIPEPHPASLLFPAMPEDELQQLAGDIKANGLLEPISLWGGQILDGRNRIAACKLADVEPKFSDLTATVPSPVVYVLSRNLRRRQLTPSQRAAIAVEAIPMLQEEAKKRQGGSGRFGSLPKGNEPAKRSHSGRAMDIAANEIGAGRGTIQRALEVKREAPDQFESIKKGEVTVGEAHRKLTQKQKPLNGDLGPKTEKQFQEARAHRRRMVAALSEITGICRGMESLSPAKIVAVTEAEEINTWIKKSVIILLTQDNYWHSLAAWPGQKRRAVWGLPC